MWYNLSQTNWILLRYDMSEMWDAYDNKFNKLNGITLLRGESIPDGIYHLVCEIIV